MVNKNLTKRIVAGVGMGAGFGLLCFMGFTSNSNVPIEMVQFQEWSFGNMMMWSTITNRMLLGFVVALAGLVTVHPVFGFKFPIFLRGMIIGLYTSLAMSFGAAIGGGDTAMKAFWFIIIAGMVIGMIIDLVITKIAGQGGDLLKVKI